MGLSNKERELIIQDIHNYQEQIEPVDVDYRETLQNQSDDELEEEWFATVGEWIISYSSIIKPEDKSTDEFLTDLLTKVKNGEETPYGFV